MNPNSKAIIILCSRLCLSETMKPFTPTEWSNLAEKLIQLKLEPSNLLEMEFDDLKEHFSFSVVERIKELSTRSASIAFELTNYSSQGINIVTRADKEYPKMIKSKLKNLCPPLFYYAGDLSICNKKSVGFVGSRNVNDKDVDFTKDTALKVVENGYVVVSGGARGIDSVAVETALLNNGLAIEYLADSLVKKIRKKDVITAIRNNQLVLFSTAKPDASFSAGNAMGRNKFIYCQSKATVVVRSDLNKGGTWSGASEAIKKDYASVMCWNNAEYEGNIALIKNGATKIERNWNCTFPEIEKQAEQISLFD